MKAKKKLKDTKNCELKSGIQLDQLLKTLMIMIMMKNI